MKAAFSTEPGLFEIRDVPTPEPAAGEALVRVKASGICGSDKNEFGKQKRPPRIAGHEFAGVVEKANGAGFRVGDRVVAAPITPTGVIGYGKPGAFAEYCAVPMVSLLPLPASLSFAEGSLVEPVAVGVHAATRTAMTGKTALVFGAGAIGLLVAQAARAKGAREVWIADIEQKHLDIATSLDLRPVNSKTDPQLKALAGATVDVVFECVGHHDAILDAATRVVKRGGELVLLGSGHPKGLATGTIVSKQLTVIGSATTSMDEMREAIEQMVAGRIRVAPLISARFPLAQMNAAFAASLGAQKVVIEP